MTDLDDNIFRLSYFERKHNFYSHEDLYNEIYMHYFSQGVKQLYVVLFGAEFLGNPFGLVVGATRGVEDLFYEPFVGAVEGIFFNFCLLYFTKKGAWTQSRYNRRCTTSRIHFINFKLKNDGEKWYRIFCFEIE